MTPIAIPVIFSKLETHDLALGFRNAGARDRATANHELLHQQRPTDTLGGGLKNSEGTKHDDLGR